MANTATYDVVVVGGGIAGSCMAGLLSRAGLGVLVLEKEAIFRDRVRGEGTWPWGITEARKAGLDVLLEHIGTPSYGVTRYEDGQVAEIEWTVDGDAVPPMIGFSHPQLQDEAYAWAVAQGVTMLRPAKALSFAGNGQPTVRVDHQGEVFDISARLVIGADGKHSMCRRWTGGESQADPEHHRMGGVTLLGAEIDRAADNYWWRDGEAVNWFAAGPDRTRLYLLMTAQRLRETGVDRNFEAVVTFAASEMPAGSLASAEQAGPIGYFSTSDTWATEIAGNGVVLIGDAAGSPNPCQGHGTSLLYHDVRLLSDLLTTESDWDASANAYAAERKQLFDIVHAWDLWHDPFFERSDAAARMRDAHERARQADPTLGGFNFIERHGPYGLVGDEAARRHFFGEDL